MSLLLQLFGIGASILMLTIVVRMIRTRKMQNEYSTLWIFIVVLLFFASVFSNHIVKLVTWIKGDANEVTLLVFATVFITLILILFSVKLSTQKAQILELSQELAILEEKIDFFKKKK